MQTGWQGAFKPPSAASEAYLQLRPPGKSFLGQLRLGAVRARTGCPTDQAQGAGCALFAFDLLFLDGTDLRRLPLADRKAKLKALVGRKKSITYVDHLEGDGATIFEHARRLGLEGIISKRRDLPYRSGRSAAWLKVRNPDYERGGSVLATMDTPPRLSPPEKQTLKHLAAGQNEPSELIGSRFTA